MDLPPTGSFRSFAAGLARAALCGAGPAYRGFRCNNATTCSEDGLYTCTCELA